MDRVELMKIEDTFMIESIGLVLAPSFDLPPEGKWKNINETVAIKTPEGLELEVKALFSVVHMNIKDPTVSAKKRWPVLVSLKEVKKESIPVGSTVFVAQSTKLSLVGSNA